MKKKSVYAKPEVRVMATDVEYALPAAECRQQQSRYARKSIGRPNQRHLCALCSRNSFPPGPCRRLGRQTPCHTRPDRHGRGLGGMARGNLRVGDTIVPV
ncbi:hypothetical protein [Prevotella sp. DNF00663]|uniref:hypothetical protein n=1 Tax=Prevotella sp. DNF00663 TaxID=1384078 RepID=UPI0012E3E445|nr:hypothetical protein [Prevotella sp. DNF00663]